MNPRIDSLEKIWHNTIMKNDRIFSAYRNMWLLVMFDLPTETAEDKKSYHDFRESLLSDGFQMIQYSVYLRYCASVENTIVHENRVMNALPPTGNIRCIQFTDRQFEQMKVFFGRESVPTEKPTSQLSLF